MRFQANLETHLYTFLLIDFSFFHFIHFYFLFDSLTLHFSVLGFRFLFIIFRFKIEYFKITHFSHFFPVNFFLIFIINFDYFSSDRLYLFPSKYSFIGFFLIKVHIFFIIRCFFIWILITLFDFFVKFIGFLELILDNFILYFLILLKVF